MQDGWLIDVIGRPVFSAGVCLIPALLEIDEPSRWPEYPLSELDSEIPTVSSLYWGDFGDVAWVRAKIPLVFGYTPIHDAEECRLTLLDEGFLAVFPFANKPAKAFPFACTDDIADNLTGLIFSQRGPPRKTKAAIAKAFWSALLSGPRDELADFTATIVTDEGEVEMEIGRRRGNFFVCEKNA